MTPKDQEAQRNFRYRWFTGTYLGALLPLFFIFFTNIDRPICVVAAFLAIACIGLMFVIFVDANTKSKTPPGN